MTGALRRISRSGVRVLAATATDASRPAWSARAVASVPDQGGGSRFRSAPQKTQGAHNASLPIRVRNSLVDRGPAAQRARPGHTNESRLSAWDAGGT